MAPTICSEKKRQTHIIASTNIRRRGQGSHQLNSALSNIVNFVAKGSVNPRISASLRIQNHNRTERNSNSPTANYQNTNIEAGLGCNHLTAISHRHKQFSFMSDNAVTSSTYSDTENSFDLRLANEILNNDSTATDDSHKTNLSNATTQLNSSLSDATALSSHTTKVSSSTPQCQERIFKRFSSVVNGRSSGSHDHHDDEIDYEIDNIHDLNSNKQTKEIHSGNTRKSYISSNEQDVSENMAELNSEVSSAGSDIDMDTENSDSTNSLNTEKSAKLKTVNSNNNKNRSQTQSSTNAPNTDGLLSIAIKTIKLVKRNQLLQQRLTQLQLETSEFIQLVMANPENRHFHENIKSKVHRVEDA